MSIWTIALLVAGSPPENDPTPRIFTAIQSETQQRSVVERLDGHIGELSTALDGGDASSIETAARNLLAATDEAIVWNATPEGNLRPDLLLGLRGWALLNLDRMDDANEAFDRAGPAVANDFGYLLFLHEQAWDERDWTTVMELLERNAAVVATTEDAIINLYSERHIGMLRQGLGIDDETNARLTELLIATDWGRDQPPGRRDWVFAIAAQLRFENDDIEGAESLLSPMQTPRNLVDFLVQDRFADLHAAIIYRHGADLAAASRRHGVNLERALQDMPDNLQHRQALAQYYEDIGQEVGLRELVSDHVENLEQADASDDYSFWLADTAAKAEARIERFDIALNIMDRLLAFGIDDHPALVNMAINRLIMLVEAGRFDQALTLAEEEIERGFGYASLYGKMFIWSTGACAAHQLGDANRHAQFMERLEANPDVNTPAMLDAYLCANDMQSAEALVLSELASDSPAGLLLQFQRVSADLTRNPWQQLLRDRLLLLAVRPAVAEAIRSIGTIRTFASNPGYWH